MKALWGRNAYETNNKISLEEIMENLKPEVKWNATTVRTLLSRLAEKNAVAMQKVGRNYKYYALAKEIDCAIRETNVFLEKVFGGSPALMFSTLTENGIISEEEREKILCIIKNMGGDNK